MAIRSKAFARRRLLHGIFWGLLWALLIGLGLAASGTLSGGVPAGQAGALLRPALTPTPVPTCGTGSNYVVTSSTGVALVPGDTLVPASQCEDCVTLVNLPFTYYLYGSPRNSVFISINGNLQFGSDYPTPLNACLPASNFGYVIFPHWDDLSTNSAGLGIYTLVSGSAPNRIFNIEWRATYPGAGGTANFEVRLYEGQSRFDLVYGAVDQGGSGATVGVQRDPLSLYTQFECNTANSLQPGLQLAFAQPVCGTPAPTNTPTPSNTPTVTPTATPTASCTPVTRMVMMVNFVYNPQTITVTQGSTISWFNEGPSAHTSTSDTGAWDSGTINPGFSYQLNFGSPGTYPYHCTLHPGMTGTINVTDCGLPTPTPTPSCPLAWRVVSSPNTGTNDNHLLGVASLSANDVWAVGYYFNGFASRTLIAHWDGAQWTVVPSPNVGTGTSVLTGVAAVSSNDVWAVGHTGTATLVERWNGSQWSIVPSPSVGTGMQGLTGVVALSANNVWAVGHYYDSAGGVNRTLIEHWNGGSWSVVSSPNAGTDSNFLWGGIAAASANDIWAVGSYGPGGSGQTLVLHWNGTQWSVVPTPNVGTADNRFYDVAAVSANDVWAVGYSGNYPSEQTLVEHWNGAAWSVVPSPNPITGRSQLFAAVAISANDVWAVGFGGTQSLAEHWDGTAWSIASTPNPPGANYPEAVAANSDSDVWAVGENYNNNLYRTFTMHYTYEGTGCPTATPTRTATPTATATPTPVCPVTTRQALMMDFRYMPPTMTIVEGTTVNWLNEGPSPHTTTSDTGVWDSGTRNPGQTYQFTFNTPGDYPYHCTLHPGMTGTITVTSCLPTATATATVTATPIPALVGHVTWQGRPAQPNTLQQLPISLTLRLSGGGPAGEYVGMATDPSGFFTVTLGGLANGVYNWRVKGPQFLANGGAVTLTGAPTTQVEMGLMRTGDCDDNNLVSASDFIILKNSFGKAEGDFGYDARADLNGDRVVNVADFALLKMNFGLGGAPPIGP